MAGGPALMPPLPAQPRQEWFVLFGDGNQPGRGPWWHRFLAPGYRHVAAMRGTMACHTLRVEHAGTRMIVEAFPIPIEETVLWYMRNGVAAHVLRLKVPAADERTAAAQLRPCMTCVEVVKAVLGLRAPHIIFPAQLARRLRDMGAQEVPRINLPAAA